ncbi:MAG TPA: ABC transporter permease [Candidatus Dormibacteraeota bacterium]|jgi:osmoprotectant transport system permease protein|nr:ABC transporter permease [Candidatus Dormibacteraeota bacterium]
MISTPRANGVRLLLTPMIVAAGIGVAWLVFFSLSFNDVDVYILNRAFLQDRFIRHCELVGISFAIAAAIGLPLGVLLARAGRWLRIPVFVVANLGQAVPSIGILVLFYAFFGLGVRPTVFALVLYSLLPILRNTMVGIQGVDPAATEAGRGMGMTSLQTLLRVEVPLAAPVIFAGLRTSLVLIIGTATLGNYVGGGGLGDVIATGIDRSDRIVFVGAVMVASLALLADWALSLVERALTPSV